MSVERYLDRIGVGAPPAADVTGLEQLQRAHLTAVPFENLDVFHHRDVRTDDSWTVPKVVDRRRGGWCFELNGAFAWLLTRLGFDVRRRAAWVLYGNTSPMPTHLTLEVRLERPYLVDVGFGDSFIKPLPLDAPGPHDGGTGSYGLVLEDDRTILVAHHESGDEPLYRLEPEDRRAEDFEQASTYLRNAPDLQWTRARFATRLLDGGPDRVTLLEDVLKVRRQGTWSEVPVSPGEWSSLAGDWFGMGPETLGQSPAEIET